ncbi:hypothetical protein [Vibrio vulnificus]|uniref:hypothetical protein n=1 Tax=Vibrio vulnificus TaxID=672 RepID=UPI0029A82590|nr:hypothetical protein [Vibrio vulnificus]
MYKQVNYVEIKKFDKELTEDAVYFKDPTFYERSKFLSYFGIDESIAKPQVAFCSGEYKVSFYQTNNPYITLVRYLREHWRKAGKDDTHHYYYQPMYRPVAAKLFHRLEAIVVEE